MENITDMHTLRLRIQELEILKREQASELKLQIQETLESLKPVNIITGTIKQIVKSPDIRTSLLKTGLLFLAGKVFPNSAIARLLMGNSLNWGAAELNKKQDDDTSPLKRAFNKAKDFISDFVRKRVNDN